MRRQLTHILLSVGVGTTASCTSDIPSAEESNVNTHERPQRIVSLDFCADQYVLKMAAPAHILALSPDADAPFSYMRGKAKGLRQIRANAEDVIALKPDLVVRAYGGGPHAARFFEGAGIPVVNIGWAGDIDGIKRITKEIAAALGTPQKGQEIIDDIDRRLRALRQSDNKPSALYMTPAGTTTGPGSLVDEIMQAAGLENFETKPGWRALPLERLAYEQPDMVASAFFDTNKTEKNGWSAMRHPIAQRQIEELPTVELAGSWLSCGAWFAIDAAEALNHGRALAHNNGSQ